MTKTENEAIFDDISPEFYYKTFDFAKKEIRGLDALLENTLGFDEKTNGFVVIHKLHSKDALKIELLACQILKNLGHAVILLDESGSHKVVDSKIDDLFFELKYISQAKTLKSAFERQFRLAKKKTQNLLIHVDQTTNTDQLRSVIFNTAKDFPEIVLVWIVWKKRLFRFSRPEIISGKFGLW
jgi:hypothetical protein